MTLDNHMNGMNRLVSSNTNTQTVLCRLLCLFAICGLAGCGGVDDLNKAADLADKFQEEFGVPVGVEFGSLQCRAVNVGDSYSSWLSFECSREALVKITSGWAVTDRSNLVKSAHTVERPFDVFEHNPNAPKWWPNVEKCNLGDVFYRRNSMGSLNGYIYVFWDSNVKRAFAQSAKWR